MNLEQMIEQQIQDDERIVRIYRAFEGDIRVITEKPNGKQTRYTVLMKDGIATIKEM